MSRAGMLSPSPRLLPGHSQDDAAKAPASQVGTRPPSPPIVLVPTPFPKECR